MLVSIITLHRITNFGSMLQTFATQRVIESMGYQAEVLDFVPDGMTFKRGCWPKNDSPVWKKLIKLIPLIICNTFEFTVLNRFIRCYINVSDKQYGCYKDILDSIPRADVYLSGSDQVWNTQNNNPQDDLKAYYLAFVPEGKRRVAYAGSFGKNSFSNEETIVIRDYLARYDSISVREDEGLNILQDFGINNGVLVLDPTLLLRAEEWTELFASKRTPKTGYVLVYNLNRNPLIKSIAKAVAKEKRLGIVNFADSFDFIVGAKNRIGNTAEDFINYVSHADYVVTDSFHGTAFSVIFNRQVIVVKAPRYNTRIESFLRLTDLIDSRLVNSVEEGVWASNNPIDYNNVNALVEKARRISYDYLRNALHE